MSTERVRDFVGVNPSHTLLREVLDESIERIFAEAIEPRADGHVGGGWNGAHLQLNRTRFARREHHHYALLVQRLNRRGPWQRRRDLTEELVHLRRNVGLFCESARRGV